MLDELNQRLAKSQSPRGPTIEPYNLRMAKDLERGIADAEAHANEQLVR